MYIPRSKHSSAAERQYCWCWWTSTAQHARDACTAAGQDGLRLKISRKLLVLQHRSAHVKDKVVVVGVVVVQDGHA